MGSYVSPTGRKDHLRRLRDSRYADVTVWCRMNRFSAHRAVLAAGSTQFAALIEELPPETRHAVIVLNEQDPDVVQIALDLVYGEKTVVPAELEKQVCQFCEDFGIDMRLTGKKAPESDADKDGKDLKPLVVPDIVSARHPMKPVGNLSWQAQLEGSHIPVQFCEVCQYVTKFDAKMKDHLFAAHPIVDEEDSVADSGLKSKDSQLTNRRVVPHKGAPINIHRSGSVKRVAGTENIWKGVGADDATKVVFYCAKCLDYWSQYKQGAVAHDKECAKRTIGPRRISLSAVRGMFSTVSVQASETSINRPRKPKVVLDDDFIYAKCGECGKVVRQKGALVHTSEWCDVKHACKTDGAAKCESVAEVESGSESASQSKSERTSSKAASVKTEMSIASVEILPKRKKKSGIIFWTTRGSSQSETETETKTKSEAVEEQSRLSIASRIENIKAKLDNFTAQVLGVTAGDLKAGGDCASSRSTRSSRTVDSKSLNSTTLSTTKRSEKSTRGSTTTKRTEESTRGSTTTATTTKSGQKSTRSTRSRKKENASSSLKETTRTSFTESVRSSSLKESTPATGEADKSGSVLPHRGVRDSATTLASEIPEEDVYESLGIARMMAETGDSDTSLGYGLDYCTPGSSLSTFVTKGTNDKVNGSPDLAAKLAKEKRYKEYEDKLRAERRARFVYGVPKLYPLFDDDDEFPTRTSFRTTDYSLSLRFPITGVSSPRPFTSLACALGTSRRPLPTSRATIDDFFNHPDRVSVDEVKEFLNSDAL